MAESLQQTRSPGRSPRSRWVVLALVLWLIGLGLSSQHVHTEPVADLHCSLCQLGHSPALPVSPVAAIRIEPVAAALILLPEPADRKSTRLNSSHVAISYAVFCLTKE